MMIADFSTTGPIEKTASEIALMHSVDKFFLYRVHSLCGIPSFTLEGSPEDWKKLRAKVEKMKDFELEWWTAKLLPV